MSVGRAAPQNKLEGSYLDRILLHLKVRDPDDRVLKTYLDSWFAYSRGGRMLEECGRPQWMNRGDLEADPDRCDEVHAISFAAAEARRRGDVRNLVRDHSIPKGAIVKELKSRKWSDRTDLREFLKLWFTVTIILQSEHRALGRSALMPRPCSDDILRRDPTVRFDRYRRGRVDIPIRLLPLAAATWPSLDGVEVLQRGE